MTRVFAVANQKGGVGKTTTAISLAAALAAMRRRVMLVDLDPQGNATTGSGIEKQDVTSSIYDVLINDASVRETMVDAEAAGYHLLPSNIDLTGAEVELLQVDQWEYRLRIALGIVREEFDYVIVDCPPSLGLLTINGLVGSDGVIIPMQCEYYALEGLAALMATISRIRERLNPGLHVEGIVRTMFDPRNSLTSQVSEQLLTHFGEQVYRNVIPRNVRLAEAPSYGVPILYYDSQSRGARAYLALAGEVAKRAESDV